MATRKGSAQWARVCYAADLCNGIPTVLRATRTRGGLDFVEVGGDDRSFATAIGAGRAITAGYLPERESFTRWVTAPFASVAKAREVSSSLLDIQIPFPLEDCVFTLLLAEATPERTTRCLLAAARSSAVAKRLDAYAAHGIAPFVLDQEGIALWAHSLYENPLAPDAARVVVCLRDDRATVAMGNSGGFIGAHNVRCNAEEIERTVNTQAGIADAPKEWAWTGPGACDAEAVRRLSSEICRKRPGLSFVHEQPALFLVRAIATRALLPGELRCDLRIGPFEHPLRKTRAQAAGRNAALALLAAGLLLCVVSQAWDIMFNRKAQAARTRFLALATELAGDLHGNTGKNAIEQAQKAQLRNEALTAPFVEAFEPSLAAALRTIAEFGAANDLLYEVVTLRGKTVIIKGVGTTDDRCEKLQALLKGMGFPVKSERRMSADGRIRFSVTSENERE